VTFQISLIEFYVNVLPLISCLHKTQDTTCNGECTWMKRAYLCFDVAICLLNSKYYNMGILVLLKIFYTLLLFHE
jgi:hypothetical protein